MDQPKTRQESKKNQKQKGQGKNGKYSAKHIRLAEKLLLVSSSKSSSTTF
jgi:hypothetical protein